MMKCPIRILLCLAALAVVASVASHLAFGTYFREQPDINASSYLAKPDPYIHCATIRMQVSKMDPQAEILEFYEPVQARGQGVLMNFKIRVNGREEYWTARVLGTGTVENIEKSFVHR